MFTEGVFEEQIDFRPHEIQRHIYPSANDRIASSQNHGGHIHHT
jgi:hypothetical protein